METMEATLGAHPFLAGLSSHHLQLLAGCSSLVNFSANQVIVREGDRADQIFLIRYGRVAVEVHRPRRGAKTIYTLGEGDLLGLFWSKAIQEWFFDVRAVEITRAIQMDFVCLKNLCDQDPVMGYEIFQRFAEAQTKKIKLLKLQLVDFYGS